MSTNHKSQACVDDIDLEMHGAALVAHPVGALDAFLPRRARTVTRLALLVRVQRLVVKELLQRDEKNVALHGSDATRRHHALGLAQRTEERLAGTNLRLGQAGLEAFEAEAVQTRQQFGSVELVVAYRAEQQVVHRRRRIASISRRVGVTLTMISCCFGCRHLAISARYQRCGLAGSPAHLLCLLSHAAPAALAF